tara:strand:- start:3461 stop:4420 length:960 start_codon:yes stop_codon:yes gene_type:complete
LNNKNIAILMGGYSSEYKVSIRSGNEVYNNLSSLKYNLFRVIITKENWCCIDKNENKYPINIKNFRVNKPKITFDYVINVIHGSPGEDGLIQSYFKMLNINHSSSDYSQSALTFNKNECKNFLIKHEILTPKSFLLNKNINININEIINKTGIPVFVKPNKGGSSFGISRAEKINNLKFSIEKAFKEDDEVIIEEEIKGREISVSVIQFKNKIIALPPTEIVTHNEFFDYNAKYKGQSDEITPAKLSKDETILIQKLSKKIYKILDLKGFSRSDFILKNNKFYFLEINTNPGLTKESILPQQALSYGISLEELFKSLIK